MLGGEQRPRGLLDQIGIGRAAQHRHRHVIELALEAGFEHLVGNLEQHRAALAAAHGVEGAAHQLRQLPHRMGHGGPFGDRTVDVGGPEGRPDVLPLGRKAGRNDQHRHVLGIGLGDARERVLDAGTVLGREHAVLPAAPDARIAVRHADADALLPAEDRPDVELRTGLDQRIARIARQKGGSLALEDLGDDVGTVHWLSAFRLDQTITVMPALVAGIYAFLAPLQQSKAWVAGTPPGRSARGRP